MPGAQTAAADLQHPVTGLQTLADEVVKLQLAPLQPGFASLAGLGGGRGASRPRLAGGCGPRAASGARAGIEARACASVEPLTRARAPAWPRPGIQTRARARV